jgi:hypothetical protein
MSFSFIVVNAPVKVSDEIVSNLFTCAVEGGSDYWCGKIRCLHEDDKKKSYDEYMVNGFKAWMIEPHETMKNPEPFTELEIDKRVYTCTVDDIKEAVKLMVEKYPETHWLNMMSETAMDAETGDVFLQLCLFKEVVYG